jgi:hypothetical protein
MQFCIQSWCQLITTASVATVNVITTANSGTQVNMVIGHSSHPVKGCSPTETDHRTRNKGPSIILNVITGVRVEEWRGHIPWCPCLWCALHLYEVFVCTSEKFSSLSCISMDQCHLVFRSWLWAVRRVYRSITDIVNSTHSKHSAFLAFKQTCSPCKFR